MAGRGRGKTLTRPAWMFNPRHPPPSLPQTQAPQPAQQRPTDWVRAAAPDGRPYWYSASTRRTTWTDPTSAVSPSPKDAGPAHASAPDPAASSVAANAVSPSAPSSSQPPKQQKDTPSAASVWRESRAPDGRAYFYNTQTRKTQWTRPPELAAPKTEPSDHAAAPTKPSSSAAAAHDPTASAAAKTGASGPAASDGPIPPGWAEQRAPDGRVYYYHAVTRETRWTRPRVKTEATVVAADAAPTHASSAPKQAPSPSAQPSASGPPAPSAAPPSAPSSPRQNGSAQPQRKRVEPPRRAPRPNWVEHSAPDGRVYYYNPATRETRWTRPTSAPGSPVSPERKRPRTVPSATPAAGSSSLRADAQPGDQSEGAGRRKGGTADGAPNLHRPRDANGKPLTDRAADAFFLSRARERRQQSAEKGGADGNEGTEKDAGGDDAMDGVQLAQREKPRQAFLTLLGERGIRADSPFLEVVVRCASDPRYEAAGSYGERRDAWLAYTAQKRREKRREIMMQARRQGRAFLHALEDWFEDEPGSVMALSRCDADAVRKFEADDRVKVMLDAERGPLEKTFFAARERRLAARRARRRKDALERMELELRRRRPRDAREDGEDMEDEAKDGDEKVPESEWFSERAPFRDLERFLESLGDADVVSRDDVDRVIRDWRRDVDDGIQRRRIREREARRAATQARQEAFARGVCTMVVDGRVSPAARWREAAPLVEKEEFCKSETELGARRKELFDYGLQLFENEVHDRRDAFKTALRADNVSVDAGATTVDSLLAASKADGAEGALAKLLAKVPRAVANALLADRVRRDARRREKERDRAVDAFEQLLFDADEIASDTPFAKAAELLGARTAFSTLRALLGESATEAEYGEVMRRRHAREERRRGVTKRKADDEGERERDKDKEVKRARLDEEDNGWAAVVGSSPAQQRALSTAEKAAVRERQKKELLMASTTSSS